MTETATQSFLTQEAFDRLKAELGEVLQTRGWDGAPNPCRRLGCAVGG